MHSGSKHGIHFYSPATPLQGWPHGSILLQDFCMRLKQSPFLQTSRKAGSMLGDGYLSSSPQNLQEAAFYWSQVFPVWYGSALHLTQKFFPQALHLILFFAICYAASRLKGFPLSSFWPWMTYPSSIIIIFPHEQLIKSGFSLMIYISWPFSIFFSSSSDMNCLHSNSAISLWHRGHLTGLFSDFCLTISSRKQSTCTWWKQSVLCSRYRFEFTWSSSVMNWLHSMHKLSSRICCICL